MNSRRRDNTYIFLLICSLPLVMGNQCEEKPDHNANWYHYWEQDGVVPELDRGGAPASRYDWSISSSTLGQSADGYDGYVVTDSIIAYGVSRPFAIFHPSILGLRHDVGATTDFPVERAAATAAHEKKHVELFGVRSSETDSDNDLLEDSLEAIPPFFFVVGLQDTYSFNAYFDDPVTTEVEGSYTSYGDNEVLARRAEEFATPSKLDQDWSVGGAQWRH
jgi:hypothetical protein